MELDFPHLQLSSSAEAHTSLIVQQCAAMCPPHSPLDNDNTKKGTKRPQSPDDDIPAGVEATSRKRARVGKRVRFTMTTTNTDGRPTEKDALIVIPRHVKEEDLPCMWYTRRDYRSFREDSQSLALAFELGILDRLHPDEICLRGLEANISKGHLEARLASRGTLTEFILRTQEAQKGHGMADPEMIRGLSQMLSKDACEDALKLAAYDREEAEQEFQKQDEQQETSSQEQ
ncbi:expressed unknown protein [Seminavis robusta]|uniref:Uncharacterized protein n=1 Tax=Seminavis robusta TaxID=568900 RepID=A0A9N8HIY4_9STRA|nr:expressed unknown protein [Seminavis robusta]|eukprot:Sro654_g182070.1 n/a (231) ;mRNA; f:25320-26012